MLNVIIFGTILVGVCLFYMFNFSESYIVSWIFKPIVPLILMPHLPLEKKIFTNIDKKDKFIFYRSVLIGLLIMFILKKNNICYSLRMSAKAIPGYYH